MIKVKTLAQKPVHSQSVHNLGVNKVFKWQFGGTLGTGGTVTAYGAYTNAAATLAFSEVYIFNDPGVQNSQTMFLSPISVQLAIVAAGVVSAPAQDTTMAQSLTFLFHAGATETITPTGFVVEAVQ